MSRYAGLSDICPVLLTCHSYILVTGATGMVGSHVVDNLLRKGFKVRAVVRSKAKAVKMQETHKRFVDQLDFYHIDDLSTPGVFNNALADINGVIHLASVSAPRSRKRLYRK